MLTENAKLYVLIKSRKSECGFYNFKILPQPKHINMFDCLSFTSDPNTTHFQKS